MSDSSETPVPPPAGPLRLDGAFARRDVDDWLAAAEASLKGATTLDALARETADGLPIPLLGRDSPVNGRVTRTAAPTDGGRENVDLPTWDNRLHVLGGTPAERAAHALAGLVGGVTSLELDVRDGSKDDAEDDARDIGSSVLALDALSAALDGVHVDMIGLSLRAGDATEAAFDALLALHRERGHDPLDARVELDGDPLGALARRGRVTGGLDAARERLARVATRAASEMPRARVATIDTAVHHDAGASPVQELVAGIAAATSALDALLDAGLDPDKAVGTLGFRVALDADIVGGTVKLRALERLWRHALGSAGLPVTPPHVVAETSRRAFSTLAPWVNHLRNVAACTAAAIGGANAVLVHPHDRVDGRRVGDDAAIADRVARNVPVLLAEEGGMLAVEDAAGGAHAIESLTQSTAEAAWAALGELQGAGGLAAALASGAWQRDVARHHTERVARLARGERVRVGVNRFRHDGADVSAETFAGGNVAGIASGEPDGTRDVSAETSTDDRAGAPLLPVRDARAFEGGSGGESGGGETGGRETGRESPGRDGEARGPSAAGAPA